MTQWTSRIRDHAVWAQMSALGASVDNAIAREGIDTNSLEGIERIRAVLALIGKKAAAIDPFLASLPAFDLLNSSFAAASSELQQFVANGSTGHIVNANAQIDLALIQASQLLYPNTSDDLTGISESAAEYRLVLEKNLDQSKISNSKLNSDIEALSSKLTEIAGLLTAERDRISTLVSEYQGQFSTAQESRNQEFTKGQADRQDKFTTLFTEYSQKLTEKSGDITQKLAEKIIEFDAQREEIKKTHISGLNTLQTKYEETAANTLAAIDAHKLEVEKLVGVIGNLGVTSGYLKAANHARKSMWLWQFITVSSFLGIIYIAYTSFLTLSEGSFSWPGFASRIFVSIAVGILAAYAASQADKYLENERRNRKLALEFEALGPYLAPLPEDMQYKFRVDVGERSFGHPDPLSRKAKDKSPASILDVLPKSKEAREFALEVLKILRS